MLREPYHLQVQPNGASVLGCVVRVPLHTLRRFRTQHEKRAENEEVPAQHRLRQDSVEHVQVPDVPFEHADRPFELRTYKPTTWPTAVNATISTPLAAALERAVCPS
ncbi:hypothetical protein H4582DRAFT_2064905 [Lactarius indigo]|nr:hypothetical protein H4582DRAFT_2064905 [Lactarius indigo]